MRNTGGHRKVPTRFVFTVCDSGAIKEWLAACVNE